MATESGKRFFIALLPPREIGEYVNNIELKFAEVYNSHAALKSPPHITVHAPFTWSLKRSVELESCLDNFTRNNYSFTVILQNFNHFRQDVIFIDVIKTRELLNLQKNLLISLEENLGLIDNIAKNRPYQPHMTVGFRDLTRENFKKAWAEYENRELYFEFTATSLTLLLHDDKKWQIYKEMPFLNHR